MEGVGSPGRRRVCTHPVSGEGLGAVLVDDPDEAWRLKPSLSIHLHRYALIT